MTSWRYCEPWAEFVAPFQSRGVGCFLPIAGRTPVKGGLVEDPLRGRVEQCHEGLIRDRAIEPEVNAGDGRGFDFVEMRQGGIGLLQTFREEFGKGGMRNREDVSVRRLLAVFIEAHPRNPAALELQSAYGRTQDHLPAPAFDFCFATIVKMREWNGGHAHAITCAARKKGFPKDVHAEPRIGAVEFLVECTNQDNTPKTIDRTFGLAAAAEPFEHGDPAGFAEIRGAASVPNDVEHGTGDGQLVSKREWRKRGKRAGKMKRGGKRARFHFAAAALRIEKREPVEKSDFGRRADASVEILKIRATTQGDVLAIVNVLAVRQHKGSCPAAEEGALLE